MIIGVISDTHINADSNEKIPEIILEAFKNVDLIIHAGDITDTSVLNDLKSLGKDVIAVSGNMDPHTLKEELPEKEIIKIGCYKIGIAHGYGHPSRLVDYLTNLFYNEVVDIIIFGHSHNPMNEKIGKILFFNPGSATDKMFAAFNSYGILEITDTIRSKIVKI